MLGTLAAAAGLTILAGGRAEDGVRAAWVRARTAEAEELAGFATRARAARADLLLVERLGSLARRDDVAYAVITDREGKALYHTLVGEVGTTSDTPVARAALAADATRLQPLPSLDLVEVDVPLAGGGVLRAGFTERPFAAAKRWRRGGVAAAVAGLGLLAALAWRRGGRTGEAL